MKKAFLLLAAALVVFGASHVSFAQDEPAAGDETIEAPIPTDDATVTDEADDTESDEAVEADDGSVEPEASTPESGEDKAASDDSDETTED